MTVFSRRAACVRVFVRYILRCCVFGNKATHTFSMCVCVYITRARLTYISQRLQLFQNKNYILFCRFQAAAALTQISKSTANKNFAHKNHHDFISVDRSGGRRHCSHYVRFHIYAIVQENAVRMASV